MDYFDPSYVLRTTIEGALPCDKRGTLEQHLHSLGSRIFGWLVKKLSGNGIGDPRAEAEDVFADFILRVDRGLRRVRDEIAPAWLWKVARNALLNHITRVLNKRRTELPMESSLSQAGGLLRAVVGESNLSDDYWTEERILALVLECIERLAPRNRKLIELELVERRRNSEVAREIGLSPKSLAALRAKAYGQLLEEIRKAFAEHPAACLPR